MIKEKETANFEEVLKELEAPPAPDHTLLYALPDVQAWKYTDPDTGFLVIKHKGRVEVPCKHFETLVTGAYRMKWQPNYHGFEVIEDDKSGNRLIYWGYKTPMMVTNRDFLCRRIQVDNVQGYNHAFFMTSEESPKKPT